MNQRKYIPPNKHPAASPRAVHDYDLLATVAASPHTLDSEVSEAKGFDETYVAQLLRSGAGKAFVAWFQCRPQEFTEPFRLPVDLEYEKRIAEEREKSEAESEHQRENQNNLLKQLGFNVGKTED